MPTNNQSIVLSVVSHYQAELIEKLFKSIDASCNTGNLQVILTINIKDDIIPVVSGYSFPVNVVVNSKPKGFGENHNSAFRLSNGNYFCVINPDCEFIEDPFPKLLNFLEYKGDIGVISPKVVDHCNVVQDNARKFITPVSIVKRYLFSSKEEYHIRGEELIFPNWIAGMFMLLKSENYALIGGFDEAYFMYCEDADLCLRLGNKGLVPALLPTVSIVHDARRSSRKKLKYLFWHLSSLSRFYFRYQLSLFRVN
ncbi:hypothetical protein MNBD_GAMMA01-789 [hydrothermal vent metagenome]|uniref:Glycosyltransferase 2-like domain-containing protein n=1 Tax=hydrothermal vent metagenome TaxID=652676 RepID=A0A3B0VDK8_9ZZZZ